MQKKSFLSRLDTERKLLLLTEIHHKPYTQIHLNRGGSFFALISIFTVFGRFFLHIHLLCMMGRFYFQTIIEFGVVTGCKVRK